MGTTGREGRADHRSSARSDGMPGVGESDVEATVNARVVLGRLHVTAPRVIHVDKNPAYIGAVDDLKAARLLPEHCKQRPNQYVNNRVEPDHRFLK